MTSLPVTFVHIISSFSRQYLSWVPNLKGMYKSTAFMLRILTTPIALVIIVRPWTILKSVSGSVGLSRHKFQNSNLCLNDQAYSCVLRWKTNFDVRRIFMEDPFIGRRLVIKRFCDCAPPYITVAFIFFIWQVWIYSPLAGLSLGQFVIN